MPTDADLIQITEVARNRHLAHIIEHADRSALPHIWHYEEEHITLGLIIEDYIAHLRHHIVRLPDFAG